MSRSRLASERWSVLALVGIGLVLVTGALAASGVVAEWERWLARAVVDLPSPATGVLRRVQDAGTPAAIVLVAGTLAFAGRGRVGAAVAVAGLAAWGLSSVGKQTVSRGRPTAETLGREIREALTNPGWTSTHTAIAVALAVVVLLQLKPGRAGAAVVVGLAVLTGLARIHVGAHWPLDVVGGAGIGLACGAVAGKLLAR